MSDETKKIIWKVVRQIIVVILSAIAGGGAASCAFAGDPLAMFGL